MTLLTDKCDLALDVDGDLLIADDGDLARTSGLGAVVQACRIALSLVRGEWFANLSDGVPYFEREGVDPSEALLGGKFNRQKFVSAFQDALRLVEGVIEIVSLTVDYDAVTREARVRWIVRTEFGDTDPDSLARGV